MFTQSNFTPRIGSNDVASSVSTQSAVIQWNARSTSAWRKTFAADDSARSASVTTRARLLVLRREERAVESMRDYERRAGAREHPQQVPRHPLKDLAAIRIAADPEQLHKPRRRARSAWLVVPRRLGYASRIARV